MKKFNVVVILIFLCGVLNAVTPLQRLLQDLDGYKIFGNNTHRMHLLGHSLAVGQRLEQWLFGHIDWAEKDLFLGVSIHNKHSKGGAWWGAALSAREQRCLALAGYVHDIGKAGDATYSMYTFDGKQVDANAGKRDHELIGFYYALYHLMSKKERENVKQHLVDVYAVAWENLHFYRTIAGNRVINFVRLADRLGFSCEELRLVGVLIGAHKLFGRVLDADEVLHGTFGKQATLSPEEFLVVLADLVRMAGLPAERVDTLLVRMIVALTLADLQSVFYAVPWMPSEFGQVNAFAPALKVRRDFFIERTYSVDGNMVDEAQARFWTCNRVALVAKKYEKKILVALEYCVAKKIQ